MTYGLPVTSDGSDFARRNAAFAKQARHCFGIMAGKLITKHRGAVQLIMAGKMEFLELCAKLPWVWQIEVVQQYRPGGFKIGKHRVDPIQAGARHDADIIRRFQIPPADVTFIQPIRSTTRR